MGSINNGHFSIKMRKQMRQDIKIYFNGMERLIFYALKFKAKKIIHKVVKKLFVFMKKKKYN